MQTPLDLTVCLLNWKRIENIKKIIDNLHGKVKIFLWDNSGTLKLDERVDWQITSTANQRFSPRWWMLSFAQTKFVCVHDDDFMFNDVSILREAINTLDTDKEKKAVGFCGRVLEDTSCEYVKTKSFEVNRITDKLKNDKETVDLITGRFILTYTSSIKNIKLSNTSQNNNGYEYHDDLDVCAKLANRQRQQFIILKSLADSVIELNDDHAAWRNPDFFKIRQKELVKYWYEYTGK